MLNKMYFYLTDLMYKSAKIIVFIINGINKKKKHISIDHIIN